MRQTISRRKEHGTTIAEMSIAGIALCLALFGVIEFGRLLFTQNALTDAVRRGARFAVLNKKDVDAVQNITVYGVNPPGGAPALVNGLTTSNVSVVYTSDFGIKQGSVTVKITSYQFSFVVPLIGATINMGEFKTTLTAESSGEMPPVM